MGCARTVTFVRSVFFAHGWAMRHCLRGAEPARRQRQAGFLTTQANRSSTRLPLPPRCEVRYWCANPRLGANHFRVDLMQARPVSRYATSQNVFDSAERSQCAQSLHVETPSRQAASTQCPRRPGPGSSQRGANRSSPGPGLRGLGFRRKDCAFETQNNPIRL